jgi:hypothetical protein
VITAILVLTGTWAVFERVLDEGMSAEFFWSAVLAGFETSAELVLVVWALGVIP